jgi:hypothetical protein
VAEPAALKALAQAADRAAKSVIGMETVKFYSSDGHEYELFIACDVSEDEWQTMPGPYEKTSQPDELAVVKLYDEIKKPA